MKHIGAGAQEVELLIGSLVDESLAASSLRAKCPWADY